MNPWGFIVAAAGFILMYMGVKGNASAVVAAFRPSSATAAPSTGGSSTPPPAQSGAPGNPTGGLYPHGNTVLPGGSVSITGPGASGLVTQ